DDHRGAAGRWDVFESPTHQCQIADSFFDGLLRNADGNRAPDRAEPVVKVRQTKEPRLDTDLPGRRAHAATQAADIDGEALHGPHIGFRRTSERDHRLAKFA